MSAWWTVPVLAISLAAIAAAWLLVQVDSEIARLRAQLAVVGVVRAEHEQLRSEARLTSARTHGLADGLAGGRAR